jgi:hypothetical protein
LNTLKQTINIIITIVGLSTCTICNAYKPNGFSTILQFAAHASFPGKPYDAYYGFVATIDVYGHNISRGQLSASTIWVANVGNWSKQSYNSIRVGWMVTNTFNFYKVFSRIQFFRSIGLNIP